MGKRYSSDLRKRVVRFVDAGHSRREAAQMEFLIGRVKAQPDITMPELAAELLAARGVEVNPASLSRALCNAGFTYKKTAHGVGARARRRS